MSASSLNLHAGLLCVAGLGVLIEGPARSGKSSLAVSLLRAAAREGLDAALVADDRVLVERRGDRLFGRPPSAIAGLIEVSGLGILRLPVRDEAAVDLLVELGEAPERLPEPAFAERFGIPFRRLVLPARQAPFGADLIVTLALAGKDSVLHA